MTRLFGTNGIRGIVNQEMTSDFALAIGKAWGTYLKKKTARPKLAVGTDARLSNAMLKTAVTAGLLATGCDVVDIGLVPTPTLQYTVKEKKFDAGVIITASHNPPQFNGIKGISSTGAEYTKETEEALEQIYHNKQTTLASWDTVGSISTWDGAVDLHLNAILRHIDVSCIKKQRFHIVVDCGNGVGSLIVPPLLEHLGCKVTKIHCELDGRFPGRHSEPLPENLTTLMQTVSEQQAHLGVGLDGDADRSIFIDEKGGYIWGDKTLCLVGKHIIKNNHGGIVVTPVTTSTCFEETIKAYNGHVLYTCVGSPVVASVMMQHNAVFGGEENGGLIFPKLQYCRDGSMSIAKILEILAVERKPLSQLIAQLPQYEMYKTKIPCRHQFKEKLITLLVEQLHNSNEVLNIDQTDGVKLYTKHGWVLLRPSGTEPIFRIYAEAKDTTTAHNLAEKYTKQVQDILHSIETAANHTSQPHRLRQKTE